MIEEIFAVTRQAWPLILTAAVIYLNWLVLLCLGLQLNGIKVKKSILFGFTLLLTGIGFLGKQAVSAEFGFFCAIPLFLFFFKKWGCLSWRQLLVTTLAGFSLAALSKIVFTGIFRYFFGGTKEYIPYQSLIIIGRGLVASIFPGFILLVASLFEISFTPFNRKRVQSGLLMISLFTLLIFLAGSALINNISVVIKNACNASFHILAGQLLMTAAMAGLLFLIRSYLITEKERELNEERLEESKRLLETLASEYREFRNKLQVMDMMVAAGKGEALGRYIQKVAEEISARNQPDYSDPIIKATLLSWRIRARERGISIIEQNNVVPVWPKPQRIAGEILSKALGVLIEEASRLRCNQVIVSGVERAGNSGFQLQISSDEEKSAGIMRIFSLSAERRSPLEDLVAKANGQIEIIADGIIIWLPGRFAEKKMSLRG